MAQQLVDDGAADTLTVLTFATLGSSSINCLAEKTRKNSTLLKQLLSAVRLWFIGKTKLERTHLSLLG